MQLAQNQSSFGVTFRPMQSMWNHFIWHPGFSQKIIFPNDVRRQIHQCRGEVGTLFTFVVPIEEKKKNTMSNSASDNVRTLFDLAINSIMIDKTKFYLVIKNGLHDELVLARRMSSFF